MRGLGGKSGEREDLFMKNGSPPGKKKKKINDPDGSDDENDMPIDNFNKGGDSKGFSPIKKRLQAKNRKRVKG